MQACFFILKSYSASAVGVSAQLHSTDLLMKATLILMVIQGQLSFFKLMHYGYRKNASPAKEIHVPNPWLKYQIQCSLLQLSEP